MENKKVISKRVIFLIFAILILVAGIICGAFNIYLNQPKDVIEKKLDGGNISLTYVDDKNLFVIENALPTSDVVGKTFDSAELFFDFTVNVDIEDANEIEYEIVLIKDESVSTALNDNVKIYLEKQKDGMYSEVFGPDKFILNIDNDNFDGDAMLVYKNKRTSSGNDNYRLRMWISDTALFEDSQIQNFGVKVVINGVAR